MPNMQSVIKCQAKQLNTHGEKTMLVLQAIPLVWESTILPLLQKLQKMLEMKNVQIANGCCLQLFLNMQGSPETSDKLNN